MYIIIKVTKFKVNCSVVFYILYKKVGNNLS